MKGAKPINHRDRQYQWLVKAVGNFSELTIETTEILDGQILVVESPKVFDWKIIPKAIDWAHKNGWNPYERDTEFRIRYTRKGFVIPEIN